jgi:DNA-binding winged helix-turn-helix (wHTH) protein/TolB-like protein
VTYRFGTFEFDGRDGALRREGRVVPLEPKPARALALLVERAGELVTREELRVHLWDAGTHVDFDRALAYCVGHVRQALGDTAENPRFVQTVPRRGFRFIAPVTADGVPPARLAPARPTPGPDEPIAAPPETGPVPPEPRPLASRWHAPIATVVVLTAVAVVAWTVAQGRSSSAMPVVAVALFDNETGDVAHDRSLSRMTDVVVERLTALGVERVGVVGNHALLRQPRPARDLDAIARDTAASFVVLVQLQTRAPNRSLLLQLIRLSDGVHVWVRRMPLTPGEVDGADEQVAGRIEAAVRRHVLGEDVEAP